MKHILAIYTLLSTVNVFAQPFEDTLYYKSGWERLVTITLIKDDKVFFLCEGKKSARKSSVMRSSLVQIKSTNPAYDFNRNAEPNVQELKVKNVDSLRVNPWKGLISVSPIDLALVGINVDIAWRFGKDLRHGIHIPARATTFTLQGALVHLGMGYNYYVPTKLGNEIYLTVIPTFYGGDYGKDGGNIGALIFGVGGTKYLNKIIGLNGYFGMGPAYNALFGLDIHLGVAFKMGKD